MINPKWARLREETMKYEDRLWQVYEAASTQSLMQEYFSGDSVMDPLVPSARPIIERIFHRRGYSVETAKVIWQETSASIASCSVPEPTSPCLIGRQSFYDEWSAHLAIAHKHKLPIFEDALDYHLIRSNPQTAEELTQAQRMEDHMHAQLRHQRFQAKIKNGSQSDTKLNPLNVTPPKDKSASWAKWLLVLALMAALGKLLSSNGPIASAMREAKQQVEHSSQTQEGK